MRKLATSLAVWYTLSILPTHGVSDIVARGANDSLASNNSYKEPLPRPLPSTWNLTVPLNYGAYLNGTFNGTWSSSFWIQFSSPSLYAVPFAYGGGPSSKYYIYSTSLSSTTTDSLPHLVNPSPDDTSPNLSLYEGRTVGGGPRNAIYGNARWGSGMGTSVEQDGDYVWYGQPYLSNITSYPFGFWPIYWGSVPNYFNESLAYRSSRYRPGGPQRLIIATLDKEPSDRPFYYIIADEKTIEGLKPILTFPVSQGGCGMYADDPIYVFKPEELTPNGTQVLVPADGSGQSRQNFTLAPESAMQYYRGSSVVLGTPIYLNAYALDHNQIVGYWEATEWNITKLFDAYFTPSSDQDQSIDYTERYQTEMKFLDCLNTTIAAAIHIPDPHPVDIEPRPDRTLLPWHIALIATSVVLLILCSPCIFSKCFGFLRKQRLEAQRPQRRTGSRRMVFENGNLLPNSSRHPASHSDMSYPMTQRQTDLAADDDVPPPYTPSTAATPRQ
jgi:hypothetical protein